MTEKQWIVLEKQARAYVESRLVGPDADAAVRGIMAWELCRDGVSPTRRESVWLGIVSRAATA